MWANVENQTLLGQSLMSGVLLRGTAASVQIQSFRCAVTCFAEPLLTVSSDCGSHGGDSLDGER